MKALFLFKSESFLTPLGLCMVSAAAREAGHETSLCEIKTDDPFRRIADLKPDILAYSASTGESKHYLKLNAAIKARFPRLYTIMGGPHPTFYQASVREGALDAICVGEGEEAFADLLSALERGRPPEEVANIVTAARPKQVVLRNLVQDLDSLPFPDFGLIYDHTPLGKYPLKSFITSRGCPYDCTYCFNHAWNAMYAGKGSIVRRHSVDYVIDQIKYVRKRWPLSCVKFYDDIFAYRLDRWLEEFAGKYRREVGLPFFILTRADLLSEDMVKLLKEAGCRTISMSIEAGNPGIRNGLLNRKMSDEQIIEAHHLCVKYGIYTFSNCIVGLPGATLRNEIESVDLAIKSKVTWLECPIFQPYPGTSLGEQVVAQGLYTPDYNSMHSSYQHRSVLNCFTRREKDIQMNLSLLGPVAVVFPGLRGVVVRFLIRMPYNHFFTFVYYLTKMHVLRKKIYVTRTTFLESVRIFFRSLKQEWFKHGDKKG